MTAPVPLLLLLYAFSPADSCRALLSIADVPESAVLYAELAATAGGDGPILLARVLELAGRFEEAASCYAFASGGASDGATAGWLGDRRAGSLPLDTVLVLKASITNEGPARAYDLTVVMPVPRSHPPYQRLEILGGAMTPGDGVLVGRVDGLPPGETAVLPVVVRVVQTPHTFRPLPEVLGGVPLRMMADLLEALEVPVEFEGSGPCLEMSTELAGQLSELGLEASVEGGLVRRGDSLVFHAWDIVTNADGGIPLDPLLWKSDSMRAVGHCPTDVIPLWDLGPTDGHELSVFYPGQEARLAISLEAFLCPIDPESLLSPAASLLRGAAGGSGRTGVDR